VKNQKPSWTSCVPRHAPRWMSHVTAWANLASVLHRVPVKQQDAPMSMCVKIHGMASALVPL